MAESVQMRRKAQWKAVFSGSGGTGCSDYIRIDLPLLAESFAAELGVDLDYEVGVDDEDRAITDECMNKFKRELKRLLQCSFALDGIDSIVRRISERRLTASAAAGGDAEEEGSDDQMEQSTDGSEHDGERTDSRVSDTEDYISAWTKAGGNTCILTTRRATKRSSWTEDTCFCCSFSRIMNDRMEREVPFVCFFVLVTL